MLLLEYHTDTLIGGVIRLTCDNSFVPKSSVETSNLFETFFFYVDPEKIFQYQDPIVSVIYSTLDSRICAYIMLPAALRRRLDRLNNFQSTFVAPLDGVDSTQYPSQGLTYTSELDLTSSRPTSAGSKGSTVSVSANTSGTSTPDIDRPSALTTYESSSGLRWNRVVPGIANLPHKHIPYSPLTFVYCSILITSKCQLRGPATKLRCSSRSKSFYRWRRLPARSASLGFDKWRGSFDP